MFADNDTEAVVFRTLSVRALSLAVLLAGGWGCDGGPPGESTTQLPPKAAGTDARTSSPRHSGESFAAQRDRMVKSLKERGIRDKRLLDAMRRVPRHRFVPPESRARSYEDIPLAIGEGQTISQPYIVALMTQLLKLEGDEKVLEVGTGSGYQAAILGELAAEVYSVEIRKSLHEQATRKLAELKKEGLLQYSKLVTFLGDGAKGYPPGAQYDAIIVTAAPQRVPVALLDQLKPGGRMVIPVGDFYQELQLITKTPDGRQTETIIPVRLEPLQGDEQK